MNIKKIIENNTLFKDFLNYFSGRMLTKGIVFLSIPIFSRLLDPEDFGVVSVFVALFLIITILIQLNVAGSIRQYILKSNIETGNYIFNQLVFFFLFFTFIILPIFLIFRNYISEYFEISDDIYYLLIIVSFSNVFISFYEFYLLGVNYSKKYSVFSFARAVIEIVISVIFVLFLFKNKDIGRISGMVLTYVTFALYSLWKIYKIINKQYDINTLHIKYAIAFSVPLIIHQLSSVILAQADRIIISKLLDFKYVGLYSMAYSLGMVMTIVVMAFNSAWLPKFYELMKIENYKQIQINLLDNLKRLIVIAIIASIGLSYVIPFIVSQKYQDSFDIIPTIIASSIFMYVYLMYANFSFFQNKTWYISVGTIIAAIVNIGLNYLLIPIYGYKIAALTTVLSYSTMAIFHYIIAANILHSQVVEMAKVIWIVIPYVLWTLMYFAINFGLNSIVILFELLTIVTLAIIIKYKGV